MRKSQVFRFARFDQLSPSSGPAKTWSADREKLQNSGTKMPEEPESRPQAKRRTEAEDVKKRDSAFVALRRPDS